MKNIKRIVFPLFKLLNIINKILYKRKDKIVFYSNLGFRDNVKALYDYLIDNNYNEKYKIICSVNDYQKYRNIKKKNVTFVSNYKGILHFLTSKYFFYSFGKYPIKPSRKQKVINLWHGTPLKNIGNLERDKKNIDYNFFSNILATSDVFADVMKDAFNCESDQVIICGHPRNDLLFKPRRAPFNKHKKLVLWLPTFRNSDLEKGISSNDKSNIPMFTNHEQMAQLNKYLKELNIELMIKLHLRQDYDKEKFKQYKNIYIWNDRDFQKEGINLYQLLGSADALITDYSSVYFDFLLLNRPIAFTIKDIEQYKKERGFVFDHPEEYMPGQKVVNQTQFYEFLKNVSRNHDEYEPDREWVNTEANRYTDGANCERILTIVGIK